MFEPFLRRQRLILRLTTLGYFSLILLAILALLAPGFQPIAFMFLIYGGPLVLLAVVFWRNDWLFGWGRRLFRQAAARGEPWELIRLLDAEAAGPDAVWVGTRPGGQFLTAPRFALVTPTWLLQ